MNGGRPRHWPLATFSVLLIVAGLAGLFLTEDLTEIARYLPLWLVYGGMIFSGALLLGMRNSQDLWIGVSRGLLLTS